MAAYAIAVLRQIRSGNAIGEYLARIDETLVPFSGRYLVHGGPYRTLEGCWGSELVVVEFPSMDMAQAWYESDAYQAIKPLRTQDWAGEVLLAQGVPDGYRGAHLLANSR